MDFESNFMWCVTSSSSSLNVYTVDREVIAVKAFLYGRIHLIWDFEHPGIVGGVLPFQIMLKHVEKSKEEKL